MTFQGEALVKVAREAISTYLKEKTRINPQKFSHLENPTVGGVFCTLNRYRNESQQHEDDQKLRGCIGRVGKPMSLIPALIDSAIDAATNDPRFPPVTREELSEIVIEVSILTLPEIIQVNKPQEYINHIKIGKHGLIIDLGGRRGLLLPQVATEHKWDAKTFLEMTCWKAFLPKDAWKDPRCHVWRFTAEIWEELEPNGKVILKKIG